MLNETKSKCGICGTHFPYKIYLINHMKQEHGVKKPYQCSFCSMKFAVSTNMAKHNRMHTGEKRCDVCSKIFGSKTTYEEHYKLHGDKPFECENCGEAFSLKRHLVVHMKKFHSEVPFECEFCQKKFAYQGVLDDHITVHTGEKPFECNTCLKKFRLKFSLKRHIKSHHSLETAFDCSVCQKIVHSKGALIKHLRQHTGERPFECNICQKKFINKFNLTVHQRMHSGEKPFECNICQWRFVSTSHLKRHMLVHTGEKPFQCKICQHSYTTKRGCRIHESLHQEQDHNVKSPMRSGKQLKTFNIVLCPEKLNIKLPSGKKQLECSFCCKKFSNKTLLIKHQRIHADEKRLETIKSESDLDSRTRSDSNTPMDCLPAEKLNDQVMGKVKVEVHADEDFSSFQDCLRPEISECDLVDIKGEDDEISIVKTEKEDEKKIDLFDEIVTVKSEMKGEHEIDLFDEILIVKTEKGENS